MGVIHQRFEELRQNYNTVELLKFDEFLHTCESTEIIEDFKSIFVEPVKGAQFVKEFVLTNTISDADLNTMKSALESYIKNAENIGYANFEHVILLEDTLELINAKMNQTTESIADLLIDSLYLQEIDAVSESANQDKKTLKAILSKDLSDEDKVKLANKFIEKVRLGVSPQETMLDITNFATITTIVLYTATIAIPATIVGILIPAPILICTNLIKKGVNKSLRRAYLRAFKSELRKVEGVINAGKGNHDIVKYKQNLIEAIDMLQDVTENNISLENTLQHVSEAQTVEDSIKELDIAILENFYNLAFREDDSVEESIQWFNNIVSLTNTKEIIITESLENLLVTEGTKSDKIRKKINVGANKLKSGAQKVKDKARSAGQATAAAKNHVDKAGKAIDDAATNAVNKAKNVYRNDVRDEIIESKTTVKLGRIIRKGIMIGSLALVNPALGAIGALTTLALRKNVKAKEKRKILNELEEELEIVNEKIEDSRGDENKEKKYQLMRIRNKLQKDINRIQYNMKADDKGV